MLRRNPIVNLEKSRDRHRQTPRQTSRRHPPIANYSLFRREQKCDNKALFPSKFIVLYVSLLVRPLQIIVSMKIIQKSRQLLVLCPNGIYLFNLSNRARTHALVNKHEKELTCMTYHKARDLLITGKTRGKWIIRKKLIQVSIFWEVGRKKWFLR